MVTIVGLTGSIEVKHTDLGVRITINYNNDKKSEIDTDRLRIQYHWLSALVARENERKCLETECKVELVTKAGLLYIEPPWTPLTTTKGQVILNKVQVEQFKNALRQESY